jgi:hypothetical protein
MAVLDHDHNISMTHDHPAGGAGQFCFFWFGVFAFIGLVSYLFSS